MRALILALLFPLFLRAEAPSPRFLTHLLGYIALDYSGAVEKAGVVSAPSEYSEMLEFVDSAIKEAAGIPAASNDVVVARGLKELKRRILGKAAPEEVANLAKSLENRVAQVCDVKRIPTSWPSLASGQKKYLQNCAQCHGVTGHGDGPAGGSLDPKPADFQSVRMSKMTPFNIFNAIRLGVPGTAMAAFPFSDEETWDVAFFVSAFHHGESIQSERPAIPLSELSERS
ncbi:MAG: cytochrome c, partial [Deltaproteobacteria bacterium]|nr:cytochrome c [Deltaproteobacteria bacterium]